MKEHNILKVPFYKVAIRFTFSFLVLLGIVLSAAEYFRNGNIDAMNAAMLDGSWVKFVLIRVAIGIVYGVAMAYFSRNKAKKLQGLK
jgi:hypothetical protein